MPFVSKEARNEYLRGWRERNRERLRASAKVWNRAHTEQKAEYRRKNLDHVNAKTREWKANNPEKMAAHRQKYRKKHKVALRAKAALYFQTHPECQTRHRAKKYGLTLEQHEALVAKQSNLCAICGGPERKKRRGVPLSLAIDHCRETGRVRGLLCGHCNTGIGSLQHDPELLRAAIAYLLRQD
jgi:hypothetical protein